MPAVKKAKRKTQHQEAIKEFEEWVKEHPKATHQQKFEAFDMIVDSSRLEELLNVKGS
jgi:hypothetical protein